MSTRWVYDPLSLRGTKAGISWSNKPAGESSQDIAPNSPLSPHSGESTPGRMVRRSMSSGAGRKEPILENLFPCWAGWDVPNESVEASVRRIEPTGRLHQQTPPWGTMTRDLRAMADGMAVQGVTTSVAFSGKQELARASGIDYRLKRARKGTD